MILLGAIHKANDNLEYKIYGTKKLFKLNNVSTELEGIYKFKEPKKGSEKDKFIIEFFGNKEIIIDDLTYQIAHYILLKEKEASRYLIDKELFDTLFQKI